MSKSDPRVRWTDEEMEIVAREVVRRFGCGIKGGLATKVRECQSVLPAARRRTSIEGPSHLKSFIPIYEAMRPEPANGAHVIEPVREVPAEPLPLDIQHDVHTVDEPLSLRDDVKDVISTFVSEVMVDAVKKLLTNGDIARMLRSLQQGRLPEVVVEPIQKHDPQPQVAARDAKPIALVCGFKPHQQHQFIQAFPGLHLKFWYSENPGSGTETLREKAKGADIVMFTMEATSHTAVRVVQSLGKKFVRVTGGGSAMQAALKSFEKNASLQ